jgi:hypothetical protein
MAGAIHRWQTTKQTSYDHRRTYARRKKLLEALLGLENEFLYSCGCLGYVSASSRMAASFFCWSGPERWLSAENEALNDFAMPHLYVEVVDSFEHFRNIQRDSLDPDSGMPC